MRVERAIAVDDRVVDVVEAHRLGLDHRVDEVVSSVVAGGDVGLHFRPEVGVWPRCDGEEVGVVGVVGLRELQGPLDLLRRLVRKTQHEGGLADEAVVVQEPKGLDARLDVRVLVHEVECFLIGRLDADVDVGHARRDVLVEQELLPEVPLDDQVEEAFPALRVRRGVLVGEQDHIDAVFAPELLELVHHRLGGSTAPALIPELLLGAEGAAMRAAPGGADRSQARAGVDEVGVGRPAQEIPGEGKPVELRTSRALRGRLRASVLAIRDASHPGQVAAVPEGGQQLHQGLLALAADHEVDRVAFLLEHLTPHKGRVHAAHHGSGAEFLCRLQDLQAVGIGGGDAGGRDDVGLRGLDDPGYVLVRGIQAHGVVDLAVEAGLPRAAGEIDEMQRDPAARHLDDPAVVRRRDEENPLHEPPRRAPLRRQRRPRTSIPGG